MKNNLILNRFFSKKMIDSLLLKNESEVFNTVIKRYIQDPDGKQYDELISEIYCILDNEYRNEYYYKNTLLNKLLFKKHNYKKTTVLTELPIGKSKADFTMINGKGVVYEIKTELDNLDRLQYQISDYYKAFTEVTIVTYKENIDRLVNILPEYVGILELTKRGALKIFRNSVRCDAYLDSHVIFKILRKNEFENIIMEFGYELPDVSQFKYYQECNNLISKFDLNILQTKMLQQLKARNNIEIVELSLKYAYELRSLIYFNQDILKQYKQLDAVLRKNYGG